jgi:glycosyltransferase involved in cell wall biosynthesis
VKAAYVTTFDSSDVRAWSGLVYYISRCLELAGITVEPMGPLSPRVHPLARVWHVEAKLRGLGYQVDRHPRVAGAHAAEVKRRIESQPCDLVFSIGTIPIAHLESRRPIAFWADATFGAMLRFYPDFRVLSKRAIRDGLNLETRALARAGIAFYASEWAARSAVEDHGADPDKVEVVPFGANMPITHSRDEVACMIRRRPADKCRLLFVGVDWVRKRGDRAVDVARVLNERGLPTELHIVGSTPDKATQLPPWVHLHGFVDKSTESGASSMRRLYEASHALVHPATAECFGVVFCEAAGHGVISLASRVGGIPSAVREGVTGALFDVDAPSEEYADSVWRMMEDRRRYEEMALAAFDEYERNLSWEVQAKRVGPRLAELVRTPAVEDRVEQAAPAR